MTTQYSPILKLALPVQGELSGTWGDVVNDNITSMVEQAIAGRAVINTWTTDSHTLTTANGVTSESRCAMLELTDTGTALTGAGTVICPAASKIYIVKNAAGQSITVKTSSGTGILVPDGRTTFLFCDGTNVVEAMTHTTSLQLGTSTTVTAVLDEDNMASDSATSLATQQSIKAYVDSQVGANNELSEVLANGNTTGGTDIAVSTGDDITFTDSSKAIFGAGSDLQIYHDGAHSRLKETGTGAFYFDVSNSLFIRRNDNSALMASFETGTAKLYHENALKLATTSTGVDVTGTITSDGLTVDSSTALIQAEQEGGIGATLVLKNTSNTNATGNGSRLKFVGGNNNGRSAYIETRSTGTFGRNPDTVFGSEGDGGGDVDHMRIASNGDVSFYEDTGTTAKLMWDASDESLEFGDNVKASFGAGSDLQIYHDGTDNYVDAAGAGNLVLQSQGDDKDVKIKSDDGVGGLTDYITVDGSTGQVKLRYYGDSRLNTSSTGVDVTGTITSDGLAVEGDGKFSGTVVDVNIIETDQTNLSTQLRQTAGQLRFRTVNNDLSAATERMRIDHPTGDISFYEDTGTTAKFFWDASAESLGIGTSSLAGLKLVSLGATGYPATSGVTQTGVLRLTGGTGLYNVLDMGVNESTDTAWIQATRANNLGVYDKLVINPYGGNVGIGNSSPTTALDVTGTITSDGLSVASASSGVNTTLGSNAVGLDFSVGHTGNGTGTINLYPKSSPSTEADSLSLQLGGTTFFKMEDGGDISFYEDTGTTAKFFWDASTERLGIGNSSPTTALDVTGDIISSEEGISTPTADGITIERPTGSVSPTPVELRMSTTTAAGDWSTTDPWGRVAFYSKDTSGGGGKVHASMEVRAAHISGGRSKLALKTSSSSADDLQDALVLDPDTGSGRHVTVSDGNLVIGTSGKGIDFSATSGPGTSELFDDYEEGLHTTTITPTTSGTISLTSTANTLFYTKIGNVVHVSGYVYVSAVSSPVGALSVSLPFPAVDIPNTGGSSAASLWLTNTNSGANVADFVGVVDEGNSYLLIQLGDGSSTQSDSAQQIKVASQIKLSLTYKVA